MLDLTAIEKPYGLLDHATKAALQAHGGPWEVFLDGKWRAKITFTWQPAYTYRVRPQAVKSREWFVLVRLGSLVASSESKADFLPVQSGEEIIKVREAF